MPDERIAEFAGEVSGAVRGRHARGGVTVRLGERGLAMLMDAGELRLPYGRLDGWSIDGDEISLAVSGGDRLNLRVTGGPRAFGEALDAHACVLPELTRGLRALGSARAKADVAQGTLFGPLLAARRRAVRMTDPRDRVQALDAALLRRELARAPSVLAVARVPRAGAERRALDAALEDAISPLLAAVDALGAAATAFARAAGARRLVAWRGWTEAARATFAAADACWPAVRSALAGAHDPPTRWRRWTRLGALLLAVAPVTGMAQHRQLRVDGATAAELRGEGFDVVSSRPGFVIVVADSTEAARLEATGAAVSEIATPVARAIHDRVALQTGAATTVYRSFDDPQRGIAAWLDSVASASPIVHLQTLGASIEGRPVVAVKIGAPDDSPSRPNVVFLATYHAREWAATEMALRLIRHLAQQPAPDARLDSLVARRDIWIIPVVNPDGYEYSHTTDRFWRKNRRMNANGSVGVDLNRNHDYRWGQDDQGSSPVPASEVYRGTGPHSEPETQAIAAFHAAHPPVLAVSYHTFTGLVLYPWGHEFGRVPDDWSIFRALAGTDVHPAVIDRLPGSDRDHYHPAPSWNLYTTNGDYTDWAYGARGVLAFTPELTSGWEDNAFYGFDFPDDESKLQRVFLDNLPFALDVLDAAADPLYARPEASGLPVRDIELESLSPAIRLRVPLGTLARTVVREPAGIPLMPDTATGRAVHTRRLVSPRIARPAHAVVDVDGRPLRYDVLAVTGAEHNDETWTATGWERDGGAVAGQSAWASVRGTLRSPPIAVPAGADTVAVLYWTRYFGNGFDLDPHGEIRVSNDDGNTWRVVGVVAGIAPVYYPERAEIVGESGNTIRLEFAALFDGDILAWWVDEVMVVRRSAAPALVASGPAIVLPSENPVRGPEVRFTWPFENAGGNAAAYDAAGREVWRESVAPLARTVTWLLEHDGVPNGVYFVVLRAGSREARGKLFVLRSGGQE
ncbi:MAG TPA: M14 family metallopeptidase [Gemmatimonadaceae bacterium]|nr:M14 family metallopeptidase [Gemmatimonadaceae bacterium]